MKTLIEVIVWLALIFILSTVLDYQKTISKQERVIKYLTDQQNMRDTSVAGGISKNAYGVRTDGGSTMLVHGSQGRKLLSISVVKDTEYSNPRPE